MKQFDDKVQKLARTLVDTSAPMELDSDQPLIQAVSDMFRCAVEIIVPGITAEQRDHLAKVMVGNQSDIIMQVAIAQTAALMQGGK